MNDREYSQINAIRRSDLWRISETPMHFKWYIDHPQEETEALLFGQAAHKFVLENETFFDEFAFIPEKIDRRTKEGKKAWEQFLIENGDCKLLKWSDQDRLINMRQALFQNKEIAAILRKLSPENVEQAFVWKDEKTGEMCKVKSDILLSLDGYPFIIDYKTTDSCRLHKFRHSAKTYGYFFQAGMYCEGIDQSTLEKHSFAFIAQEKNPPYACRLFYVDETDLLEGKMQFHELLDLYHACKEADDWYGYESAVLTIGDTYE